jgi:DNA-directed RNA polymerase subunit M/transcription elongation factor TFIIS
MLVMHIWHKSPSTERVDADMIQADRLFKDMLAGLETNHHGIAYKSSNEINRRYDFHKTKRTAVSDAQDLCVSCHGDIPHFKKKETRAFLNMHSFFMACETCHLRYEEKSTAKFIWYNKSNGEKREQINLDTFLGNTPYKLMPVNHDGTSAYDNVSMVKYVDAFKSNVTKMTSSEKRAALKKIHEPMTAIKESVTCIDCHQSDRKAAYLPFERIGYPERRADQLFENEVVGMLYKYKKFYLPDLLAPKEESASEN